MTHKNFITIQDKGITDAIEKLGALPEKVDASLRDATTLAELGATLMASAVKTINAGGRPTPYKPLADSTKAAKQKKYKGKSSLILVAGGPLRQTLDYDVQGGTLFLTSVDYLKYHQFEENRVKARFPARPVWGVQDEDRDEIIDIVIAGIERNL